MKSHQAHARNPVKLSGVFSHFILFLSHEMIDPSSLFLFPCSRLKACSFGSRFWFKLAFSSFPHLLLSVYDLLNVFSSHCLSVCRCAKTQNHILSEIPAIFSRVHFSQMIVQFRLILCALHKLRIWPTNLIKRKLLCLSPYQHRWNSNIVFVCGEQIKCLPVFRN